MNALSTRSKIALLSTFISGVVLVAFGLAALSLVSRQKLESLDTEIRSLGARHPGWIANRGNYDRLDSALEFIFGAAHANQIILLVKDADETVLHVSTKGIINAFSSRGASHSGEFDFGWHTTEYLPRIVQSIDIAG